MIISMGKRECRVNICLNKRKGKTRREAQEKHGIEVIYEAEQGVGRERSMTESR